MMKLRYLFGIPYLFFFGMMGGDIIYDALVIGVLAGFTDIIREGGTALVLADKYNYTLYPSLFRHFRYDG